MATPSSPLGTMAWAPNSGVNMPQMPQVPMGTSPFGSNTSSGPVLGNQNPYGQGSRGNGNETYNLSESNLQTGLARNQLIPQFSQQLFGLTNPAAAYYNKLMNLGSPYYQQQQRASFEQGNQQSQNAAAQARQQLASQGYGFTPSGAEAGMIGGMAQQSAGNLATTFLQNLFQNENLQLQGAQGLGQIAQMFNPAQLMGQTNPDIQQPTNTAAQIMGGIGSMMSGMSGGAQTGYNIASGK